MKLWKDLTYINKEFSECTVEKRKNLLKRAKQIKEREASFPNLFIIESFRTNLDIILLFVILTAFHYALRPGKFCHFIMKGFFTQNMKETQMRIYLIKSIYETSNVHIIFQMKLKVFFLKQKNCSHSCNPCTVRNCINISQRNLS